MKTLKLNFFFFLFIINFCSLFSIEVVWHVSFDESSEKNPFIIYFCYKTKNCENYYVYPADCAIRVKEKVLTKDNCLELASGRIVIAEDLVSCCDRKQFIKFFIKKRTGGFVLLNDYEKVQDLLVGRFQDNYPDRLNEINFKDCAVFMQQFSDFLEYNCLQFKRFRNFKFQIMPVKKNFLDAFDIYVCFDVLLKTTGSGDVVFEIFSFLSERPCFNSFIAELEQVYFSEMKKGVINAVFKKIYNPEKELLIKKINSLFLGKSLLFFENFFTAFFYKELVILDNLKNMYVSSFEDLYLKFKEIEEGLQRIICSRE